MYCVTAVTNSGALASKCAQDPNSCRTSQKTGFQVGTIVFQIVPDGHDRPVIGQRLVETLVKFADVGLAVVGPF